MGTSDNVTPMNIGFVGAQRVGKTTTARAVAEQLDLRFVQTDVGGVWKRLGLDPKVQYPIKQRIEIQEQIIDYLVQHLREEAAIGNFTTDRTPLDVLGYMEADILRDFPVEYNAQYFAFVQKCKSYHEEIFGTGLTVLLQPGIPPSEADKSAAFCLPYMWHLTSLYKAYLELEYDPEGLHRYLYLNNNIIISKNMLDLQERVDYVVEVFQL